MKTKKSFFVAALRALVFSAPVLISTAVTMFAFKQTFGIGLVLMCGLIAVQFILSLTVDDLKWDEFNDFNFSQSWENELGGKKINIAFNFARFGTIISTLVFLFQSGITANPFGGLGLAIAVACSIICLLLFFALFNLSSYRGARGVLAILIIISLIVFSYLFFGTQLIWMPFILSLVFSLSKGFNELDLGKYRIVQILAPFLLLLVAIISSIIQFNEEIFGLFIDLCDLISNGLMWNLFGLAFWIYLLGMLIVIVSLKINKAYQKKTLKLKQEAQDEKLRAEKNEKNKQQEEACANRVKSIVKSADEKHLVISTDDLSFISDYRRRFSDKEIVKIMVSLDLFNSFVTVSDIKKQIFYKPSLFKLLEEYNDLFKNSTDDDILKGIIEVLDNLIEHIDNVKTYKGSEELIRGISNHCKDFSTFSKI